MKLNNGFNRTEASLIQVAKKNIFFTGVLVLSVILSGCSSSRHTSNRTKISIEENRWLINGQPVNKGSSAEGLLMNVRMVNAVFEDTGPARINLAPGFDPEKNTGRFVAQVPDYVAHGVRGFTISLQGGSPKYEGAINSAFNANGDLRASYMDRVEEVVRVAESHRAVIILSCFYQRQHSHERALKGKQAMLDAVANVAKWILDKKFVNVVLEISNEYAHGGYSEWRDGEWLKSVAGQMELIRHAKATAPDLLVSTSGMGNGMIPEAIARASDYITIHFNNTALEDIPERIKQSLTYGKPVICNEDDKIGETGAEAARLSVVAGAGWGLMDSQKNQSVPFEFDGAADDTIVYRMLARLTTTGESVDTFTSEQLSVLVTAPKDGDVFQSGIALNIRASATGVKGMTGIEVHFYINGQLIGKSAAYPWEISWKNAQAGKHQVTAVVLNSKGKKLMTSRLVDFEVKDEDKAK